MKFNKIGKGIRWFLLYSQLYLTAAG